SKVIVIGHSEGSLIGMIASEKADQFVSIAGAGQSADKLLKLQLVLQGKQVEQATFPIIDSLKIGRKVDNVSPFLYSLFRPSVQPYLISWFKFDPQVEIAQLKIPVLVVQGTNDVQVSVDDAKSLVRTNVHAKLLLIEEMNNILKIVKGDRQANLMTYSNPSLPISDELINEVSRFIFKK
ncbi:MAG: alpha/beta fold hydrolase, partial [Flammeovirgaceae bacterium]